MTSLPSLNTRRPAGARGRSLLAVSLLALALAACQQVDKHIVVGSVPEDYHATHPISVEESVDTMDVPVGMNTAHLTRAAKTNIQGFAQKYITSQSTVIAVVAPSGSANERVATWISYEVKDALIGAGVDPKTIDMRVYRADPSEATAPIRIAYSRMAAQTAGCGPWPDQFNRTSENKHYHNYGCATQQNLAAMVDSPLDLLYPRGMTPADTARRTAVLDKYRTAGPTQGDYSKEPGGNIAQGVGQ